MKSLWDLIDILWRTAAGTLDGASIEFSDDVSCCVVMCSEGYPGPYLKGHPINGVKDIESENLIVFHAGTQNTDEGLITSGGRVLGVTAIAKTIEDANKLATEACNLIDFSGAFWRTDIGLRFKN